MNIEVIQAFGLDLDIGLPDAEYSFWEDRCAEDRFQPRTTAEIAMRAWLDLPRDADLSDLLDPNSAAGCVTEDEARVIRALCSPVSGTKIAWNEPVAVLTDTGEALQITNLLQFRDEHPIGIDWRSIGVSLSSHGAYVSAFGDVFVRLNG